MTDLVQSNKADIQVRGELTSSEWYFSQKGIYIFLGIVLANYVLIWLSKNVLIDENVFYNTFSEQLTYDRSLKLFESSKKMGWVIYVFYPLVLMIKVTLVSFAVYVGLFFSNGFEHVSFSSLFKVVIASEIAFILSGLAKFFWFCFFVNSYTINDIEFFYPLSLINFFKRSELQKIWIYPLQTINIFHFLYILFMAVGLRRVCSMTKTDSEKLILVSYPVLVILWNVIIMFLVIDNDL
jgi:hypothetical protein